jgi:hypothetical protein
MAKKRRQKCGNVQNEIGKNKRNKGKKKMRMTKIEGYPLRSDSFLTGRKGQIKKPLEGFFIFLLYPPRPKI